MFLTTKTKIRPAQLENAINTYNEHVPGSKTAVLTCIDGYKSVITFNKKYGKYTKHTLYKLIKEAKDNSNPTYMKWTRDQTKEDRELIEFDVVKKQRTINAANEIVGADITTVLLGEDTQYFYSFSNAVMGALSTLSNFEATVVEQEAQWMQEDYQSKTKTRIGYAYAAINTCLGDPTPVKMGATMKDSPYNRLKELSSCLPQSFELLACVPTTDPFAVEKLVHAHFDQFRIKKRSTGRNTEFFMVSKDVVCKYFADLNQELLLPA